MKENQDYIENTNIREWSEILSKVLDVLTDRTISDLIKAYKGQDLFARQRKLEELNGLIEEFFASILPEKGNRLVVFVDELDRCSPSYAVKLLERVKHFFSLENVTFVFAVNTTELQHSIRHFYGENFDSSRYMDRFFDFRIELSPMDMEKYIQSLGVSGSRNLRQAVCAELVRQMNMGMREASRFIQMSKIAAYKYTDGDGYEKSRFRSYDDGYSNLIAFCVVVPLALALRITDFEEYDRFITGKSGKWLENVLLSEVLEDWVMGCLLENDESYSSVEGKKKVDARMKIQQLYNAIFVKSYEISGEYSVRVGKPIFTKDTKVSILKAMSMASPYSDFTV